MIVILSTHYQNEMIINDAEERMCKLLNPLVVWNNWYSVVVVFYCDKYETAGAPFTNMV